MKTVTASDANRGFSALLREVSKGEEVTILSRGRPVAKITPATSASSQKNGMKNILLARLKTQDVTGDRTWTRAELYD
jgi:prevent-host-death family protein